jgi:hypothetical protein
VEGSISQPGDRDLYSFAARKGEPWIFEINASRSGSSLDSKIEVLSADEHPLESMVLQSMRTSWLAFRGRDSATTDDFRIQHWREAELNEYLYCDGEVTRLWAYPNGPDSGFTLYPGFGNRHTFFGTTACSHALGAPLYIVRPLPPGTNPVPNGLPLFRLHYENDDDPSRIRGRDSWLHFIAPHDGTFLLRVSDTRGFGDTKAAYRLIAHPPKPDFTIRAGNSKALAVGPGSGKEVEIAVDRADGFEGEVEARITGLPEGFHSSPAIVVEAGQPRAFASVWADPDAKAPTADAVKAAKIVARAQIEGREITHEIPLGEVQLGPAPKLTVAIAPEKKESIAGSTIPLELHIRPGETIYARVVATRVDFTQRIEFGRAESCKNLPHGVFVDNLGLNGILIVEGETERTFALTAARWVKPSSRWIFLRSSSDGVHVSRPVLLHVDPAP